MRSSREGSYICFTLTSNPQRGAAAESDIYGVAAFSEHEYFVRAA